jgi:ATP-binding cassette subfamily F protein 3
MLAGVEAPDAGTRREGHQVVAQYFPQDAATALDPTKTVYGILEADSPVGMVPMIRNILGGFLFAGDDIYKKVAVLSGGERTRLAVARMLLTPANTLMLDEPTNHLDLDSKDVLLEALEDFGGTLIFVSHDRYFVDRLATKIIEVGHGSIEVYPGTYEQFLWSKIERQKSAVPAPSPSVRPSPATPPKPAAPPAGAPMSAKPAAKRPDRSYDDKKREDAESRKRQRATRERERRISDLEARIAERERTIKDLEARMAEPGFYDRREAADDVVAQHQRLMWEVGALMNQWEAVQGEETTK